MNLLLLARENLDGEPLIFALRAGHDDYLGTPPLVSMLMMLVRQRSQKEM